MEGFAPLSRENPSNRTGFPSRTGANAEHQHVAVWMLRKKTLAVAVPSAKLSVQGTLQFRLQGRVEVVPQFYRPETVLQSGFHQPVDGGFIEPVIQQVHHLSGCLHESAVARIQSKRAVVVQLWSTTLHEGPATVVVGRHGSQPALHQTGLHQRSVEDADVFPALR